MRTFLSLTRTAAHPFFADLWGVARPQRPGSFREEVDTGNSNRVLGLFRGLAKGVK